MRIFTRARHKRRRYRKLTAMVLRSGLSLRAARTIGNYAGIIVEADGFRSAWREASTSLRKDRERIEAERAAQRRLVENAGLVGSDQDGTQLDQREHAETKEALRWLATCQMGHYRNLQRYRNDEVFVAIIRLTSEQHGLPKKRLPTSDYTSVRTGSHGMRNARPSRAAGSQSAQQSRRRTSGYTTALPSQLVSRTIASGTSGPAENIL